MTKRGTKILKATCLMAAWFLLLLAQHIACFDMFDSNLWYLYLEALGFAVLHIMLLKAMGSKLLPVCFGIYAVAAILKVLMFAWITEALSFLCIALDVCGAIIASRKLRILNQQ